MSYEVLYRKWRPQRFADVAGQHHVTTTLRNAIASGRISHAYLFAGPRGTGKTTTGRILAKTINCVATAEGEPCDACPSCESYLAGRALDLVEMDAASNRGIEDIRDLRERIGIAPGASRYRVYLVDEVHQLTSAAFNALLKTLEEPPPHAVFVLATTEVHDVPATISSRCQRFDFRRITIPAMVERLAEICRGEEIEAEEEALSLVARQATGSLRDAINLVDQIATQTGHRITAQAVLDILGLTGDARVREVARSAVEGDLGRCFELLAAVRDDGVDLRRFHKELLTYLRGLMVIKAGAADTLDLPPEDKRWMGEFAAGISIEEILRVARAVSAADLRADPQSSLPLEIALATAILGQAEARPAVRAAPAPRAAARPARTAEQQPAARAPEPAGSVREFPRAESASRRAEAETAARAGEPERMPASTGPVEPSHPDFVRQLYQAARPINFRAAAFVNGSCEVVSWEAPKLTLGVFESHKFALDKLMLPEIRQVIESAAAGLLGSPVQLTCVVVERKPRETAPAAPPNGEPRGGHLIEAARQMGAQPIGDASS